MAVSVITVIVIAICLRRTLEGHSTSAISLLLPAATLLMVTRIGVQCLRHGQREPAAKKGREPEALARPSLFPPGEKQV